VWEWCEDGYHTSYEDAPTDGSAWNADLESATRLLRGGSWDDDPANCRSAVRDNYSPGNRDEFIGFRVVYSSART
jgi:formylglycine-generating enzyme required for sulfatase activity